MALFCLTVEVIMSLDVQLYVLIGVGGWVKLSSCSVMRRGKYVYPLLNSPLTSASVAYTITCFSILNSVWIGPFAGGMRFGAFPGSAGSELS